MRRPVSLTLLFFVTALAMDSHAEAPVTLNEHITPVLKQYCFDCHNPDKQKGDINLVDAVKNAKLDENREVWSKVLDAVENGDMPPEKKPQLPGQQRDMVVSFLDGQLSQVDCTKDRHPGRVTIRRLNRLEYRNTVRDLLKVDFNPEDFPNDDVGYGFDNIGDVLSISPMLMEKYMAAAETVAQKAIVTGDGGTIRRLKGNEFEPKGSDVRNLQDGALFFVSEGEGVRSMEFPQAGEYTFRIRAYGDQAGAEPVRMALTLDGKEVGGFDVRAVLHHTETYELKTSVEKGWHKFGMAFRNDFTDPKASDPSKRDRNLYVESVEIVFPPGVESYPESHREIITHLPAAGQEHAVAMELLAPLLKRAYRRPVNSQEVERVASFVDLAIRNKATFLEGMQLAVQAILCSPQFLFRWELDTGALHPGEVRELNDHEVASRLSYFLWSSMPDPQLTELADKGELRKNGNFEKQIARMLGDWKARSLVNGFADQWLQIRNIWEITPDPNIFPKWKDDLKSMMKQESELFFEAVMKEDRNVLDLLDGRFTFLNETLANYYGIPGVHGPEFRKVELPADSPRGGVLTQGAVLLATSTPTRTSPVIRGKWILEEILGTPPPSPPANVPPLAEQSPINQSASLRERFSAHSNRPECAGCHKRMDPLGFALENFDATGAWRDRDGKFPVDASGKLADGRTFGGPRELKAVLKSGDGFIRTLAEKMMTYALGRGLDLSDRCAIKDVVAATKEHGDKFSALVTAIAASDPFLKREIAPVLTQN